MPRKKYADRKFVAVEAEAKLRLSVDSKPLTWEDGKPLVDLAEGDVIQYEVATGRIISHDRTNRR